MKQVRLCFFAPSGSGKSVAAKAAVDAATRLGYTASLVKLALPLYEIQSHIYNKLGIPISFYQQDQLLLERIASEIRRISPRFIVDTMLQKVASSSDQVVINDDVRDWAVDVPALVEAEFKLVRIQSEAEIRQARLARAGHLSIALGSKVEEGVSLIKEDMVVENNGNRESLEAKIGELVKSMLEPPCLQSSPASAGLS